MQMKKLQVVGLISALSLASIAHADALKLKLGAATTEGVVGFTLTSGSASIHVDVALQPMSAAAKAAAVRDALAAQDQSGTWTANVTLTSLTFEHFDGQASQAVDSISDLKDTTGGGTQLKTKNAALVFNLQMSQGAVATGVDAQGNPSFITVSLTNSLVWTRAIHAGDTPQVILDAFSAFLQDEAEDTVDVVRETPAAIVLTQAGSESLSLNWQVTDTGLLADLHGSGFAAIDR
jgi:hypothetical protein